MNSLKNIELQNKVVLVRVDINVPLQNGVISDATRIERIRPTLDHIIANGGKPVLLAHFGRPKGKVVSEMSLEPVANAMPAIIGHPVKFSTSSIGQSAQEAVSKLKAGEILVLENTRFHEGEEKNDIELAREWAKLGDIFCNDAFSAAHRAHASTEAVAHLLPNCVGLSMEMELTALEKALSTPERPVIAIVGGAKISTKLDLLSNMIEKTDHIVIGGGMANTFLAAQGASVGKSLCEHDLLDTAREILAKAKSSNCEIYLPSDVVVAREFKAGAASEVCDASACPDDAMILDAGPKAISDINALFEKSKTLVWNGPLGAFEIVPFDTATNACAQHAAKLTQSGKLISIAGGGDTVSALNASDSADSFTYISTAGGAFLEWMEGKVLPGVAALEN